MKAFKGQCVILVDSPGTVDQDYVGEIQVRLCYLGPEEYYELQVHEPIASLVFAERCLRPVVTEETHDGSFARDAYLAQFKPKI